MITISDITFVHKSRIILDKINLTIRDNEVLGIIGKSGSGKSTLLKILAGKEKSYKGSITLNDTPLESINKKNILKTLTYFNGTAPLNTDDTVESFIQLSRLMKYNLLHPLDKNDKETIENFLDLFSLQNLKNEKLRHLSDSSLTTILLAYCFVRETPYIFLDEPTIRMDLKAQMQLHRIINKETSTRKESVVIASNNINFITQTADRIIVLHEGAVVEEGAVDIVNDELIKKYFDLDVLISRNIYNGKPEVHFFPVN